MQLEEFKNFCEQGKCLRRQKKVKSCVKDYRRERCYKKYNEKTIKIAEKKALERGRKKDEAELQQTINYEVRARDRSCLVWKILSPEEKKYLQEKCADIINVPMNKREDCAHILPKSKFNETRYDIDNIFLCTRFFHRRLDDYRDLVTNEYIGENGKRRWIERIMRENMLWEETYTYENFLADKEK